jgi:hypothetical protein
MGRVVLTRFFAAAIFSWRAFSSASAMAVSDELECMG